MKHIPTWAGLLLAAALFARPALAQSERQLRGYFEGKNVMVKLDMPGTEAGIDVRPDMPHPIHYPDLAKRLKTFGTSLHRGDQATVTKVKVKNDLIEFQLGGGGYGTFGDDASPNINIPLTPKSVREKNLEQDLQNTSDPALRRRLQEELDGLRRSRQREDSRNQARAAEARQIKEANIRQRRAEGGSRFNIRFRDGVPPEMLTPDGLMRVLADYVDFAPAEGNGPPMQTAGFDEPAGGDLRKGLTVEEVDAIMGRPESIGQRREGTLNVSTSTYRIPGRTIMAEFVEGVLIRYTISSSSR
jgi:hypothetical protein